MNANLRKYLDLKAIYKAASDRLHACRDRISRELGVELSRAQDHPDYKALDAEVHRLYLEIDALTPHVIRANLENFGINDMAITGVLRSHFGRKLGEVEMVISDLCGLRYAGLAKRLDVEEKDVEFRIMIKKDGEEIGYITSDGVFNYEKAPDLRTALGWRIATDGGRTYIIGFFHLDQATRSLLDTVRVNGTKKEVFFGPYFEALKSVFIYERTTRFGDGYCGAATTLWHVATRELGEEHPGYSFSY